MPENKKSGANVSVKPIAGPGQMGRGMRGFAKPKNFKKSIGQLLKYLRSYWLLIVISIILSSASTAFLIIGPRQMGLMTNQVVEYFKLLGQGIPKAEAELQTYNRILEIGSLLIILYIISWIFSVIQGILMTQVTLMTAKKMRYDITTKVTKLPLKYFDANSYGDVLSRITNDVDTISQSLYQTIHTITTSLTIVVGYTIMMFTINASLTLIALLSLPICAVAMIVIMKKTQKYFIDNQMNLGKLNGHIEEIYSGHNVIKVFNAEEKLGKEFTEVNQKLTMSGWKSQFYSGIVWPITNFIGNLCYVVIYVFCGVYLIQGFLVVGDIQSMVQYVMGFNRPLAQVAQISSNIQMTAAAAERIFEILNEPEMEAEQIKAQLPVDKVEGNVEFKHVKFGYNEDKTIINDFSFKVKKGQKIAIVGPTGAGKTTIVNLLMRFYEINEGEILIDGISTQDISRENVHALFGMVLQDTWLFKGTIEENLAYGRKGDCSLEEIIQSCKIAHLHHFIESLPGGYQMVLDDDSNISQGQKQLLTIARAMIADAPMLILDEATSSVDTRTEILIQDAMDKLMKNRTTFIIAHRLSTIKNADLILVMKDGDIIESGNHEELIAQNGFYAELYNSQFEKISDII